MEVEVQSDRRRATLVDPTLPVVANQDDVPTNLKGLTFHWGTYTAPFFSDYGTLDEERGGTFHRGGSHFYHNTTLAGTPGYYHFDKAYAINSNTYMACLVPAPVGVRAESRPPFYLNPLMTIAGENADGLTNGYEYVPYLTRI